MASLGTHDPNAGLERQALKRPLTGPEVALSHALEDIFKSGIEDFEGVAALLNERRVAPPSGAAGPWSIGLIESELRAINRSLDAAYLGQ